MAAEIDSKALTSDSTRMLQLLCMAVVTGVCLLKAFWGWGGLDFFVTVGAVGVVALGLGPVAMRLFGVAAETPGQTAHLALKAAEAGAIAGLTTVAIGIGAAFGALFGNSSHFGGVVLALFFLTLGAIGALAVAAGVGLVGVMRANGVVIEAPRSAAPATEAAAQWTPEQWAAYQQQQAAYQQQQGGGDPNAGA
jgi:hypothetical protein